MSLQSTLCSNFSSVFWRLLYSCLHQLGAFVCTCTYVCIVFEYTCLSSLHNLAHVLHLDLAPHLLTVLHRVIEPVQQWYFQLVCIFVAFWSFCLKNSQIKRWQLNAVSWQDKCQFFSAALFFFQVLFNVMGCQLMTWERHEQLRL